MNSNNLKKFLYGIYRFFKINNMEISFDGYKLYITVKYFYRSAFIGLLFYSYFIGEISFWLTRYYKYSEIIEFNSIKKYYYLFSYNLEGLFENLPQCINFLSNILITNNMTFISIILIMCWSLILISQLFPSISLSSYTIIQSKDLMFKFFAVCLI